MEADAGTLALPARAVERARLATYAGFFVLGAGAGVWAVHIPLVKERLGIDESVLGLVLLTLAIGSVIAMPLTGGLVGRHGSKRMTTVLSIGFAVVSPLPILAPTLPLLFAGAFAFGLFLSSLDIAVNVQAAEVERARLRPTMSSFHGFFSVGALAGAGVGALVVGIGWGDGRGALVFAAAVLATALIAAPHLLASARAAAAGPRFVLPSRPVLAIGIVALLGFGLEGAVADWSALYLTETRAASPAPAAAGFALFSLAMSAFRLGGDVIVARLGGRRTLLLGGLMVAAGTLLALLAPPLWVAAVGFGLIGVGAANIVPVVFSAAANTPGVPPGIGVAAVATLGYSGYLFAPPLLGFLAHGYGLAAAIAPVAIAGIIVATMFRAVRS